MSEPAQIFSQIFPIWLYSRISSGSLTWDLLSVSVCVLLGDAVPAAVSELLHAQEEGNMRTAE